MTPSRKAIGASADGTHTRKECVSGASCESHDPQSPRWPAAWSLYRETLRRPQRPGNRYALCAYRTQPAIHPRESPEPLNHRSTLALVTGHLTLSVKHFASAHRWSQQKNRSPLCTSCGGRGLLVDAEGKLRSNPGRVLFDRVTTGRSGALMSRMPHKFGFSYKCATRVRMPPCSERKGDTHLFSFCVDRQPISNGAEAPGHRRSCWCSKPVSQHCGLRRRA